MKFILYFFIIDFNFSSALKFPTSENPAVTDNIFFILFFPHSSVALILGSVGIEIITKSIGFLFAFVASVIEL